MHTHTHTHSYIYIYIHTHTHTHIYTYLYTYTHIYILDLCALMQTTSNSALCLWVMKTCLHTHTHTYTSSYTYTQTHMYTRFVRTDAYNKEQRALSLGYKGLPPYKSKVGPGGVLGAAVGLVQPEGAFVYVCMYVCVYVCTHVCVHTYTEARWAQGVCWERV